jgi:RNA polymerase sigma factor (TIGR02999 family)
LSDPESITRSLAELREGRAGAMDRLVPLVYSELHAIAHRELMRRRPGDTLDTTALVHEAYVKLAGSKRPAWNDRVHFMAVCATAMRHIIVDYALKQQSRKRGGGLRRVSLDDSRLAPDEQAREILALNAALDRLAQLNERLSQVVECRFFGGLSVPETAEALKCSPRTVDRDWRKAKAWLYREIRDE